MSPMPVRSSFAVVEMLESVQQMKHDQKSASIIFLMKEIGKFTVLFLNISANRLSQCYLINRLTGCLL